jgi:hypothetical protein
MGTSIWSDKEFDTNARELRDLQNKYPDIAAEGEWAKEFEDWDATTGFHLPLENPWVYSMATAILNLHKRLGGEQFE